MMHTIYIVGARGAGKTTIGTALAQVLAYRFIDTDRFVQHTTRLSVAEVVAREGWSGFRLKESVALQTATAAKTVIATGGGVVLSADNREYMRNNGRVIYLRASANVLANRLVKDPKNAQRPSLTGKPIIEEMQDILASREKMYQDVAHHVLDAAVDPWEVVTQIINILVDEAVR